MQAEEWDQLKFKATLVYRVTFRPGYTVRPCLKTEKGAGEMAQWLRPLVAFSEDIGSMPGTHGAAHSCL